MTVAPIPPGYAGVTPYLIVRDAAQAIDFYKRAFGATEALRLLYPDGKVAHAELAIGQGFVMLAEEMAEGDYRGPQALGGTPVSLLVYVPDVDAAFARAVAAGAKVQRPVADQFYGDRSGVLVDPFGHVWSLATHQEDVSAEEMSRRMQAMIASGTGAP
jgi:PhnB protein